MADPEDTDAYPPDDTFDGLDEDSEQDHVPSTRAAGVRQQVMQAKQTGMPKGLKTTYKKKKVSKNANRVLAMEKQRKALELRKGGASYAAIATAVGYKDQSGARKAVQRAFKDVIQEPALEVKTIQIERLNHMLLTLWPKVQQGDERAIDTSLRVMDKIDRLMGTEAAQAVDVNIHQQNAVLVIDGNNDDYINAMKRMAGINGDGTNKQIAPPQADQRGVLDVVTQEHHQAYHPDFTDGLQHDVVDAEVVDDEQAINNDQQATKKKFSFGMDPNAWKQQEAEATTDAGQGDTGHAGAERTEAGEATAGG